MQLLSKPNTNILGVKISKFGLSPENFEKTFINTSNNSEFFIGNENINVWAFPGNDNNITKLKDGDPIMFMHQKKKCYYVGTFLKDNYYNNTELSKMFWDSAKFPHIIFFTNIEKYDIDCKPIVKKLWENNPYRTRLITMDYLKNNPETKDCFKKMGLFKLFRTNIKQDKVILKKIIPKDNSSEQIAFLYIFKYSNDDVKVGQTKRKTPTKRMLEHEKNDNLSIISLSTFECPIDKVDEYEKQLISLFTDIKKPCRGREYFRIPYIDAVILFIQFCKENIETN